MSVKVFGWGGLVWAPTLGLCLLALGGNAIAQDAAAGPPTYVGDVICGACHQDKYESYMLSGHPWKLVRTGGQVPPADTWPHTPVPPVPANLTNGWADVEYVIGNFFWKARYVKRDGYIDTGDAVQWNIASQQFGPWNSGKVKKYNCGPCHTTGYNPQGSQGGLAGIVGTWAMEGIRCEACHGAGGPHGGGAQAKDCKDCHYRDPSKIDPTTGKELGFRMHMEEDADGHFFEEHHQQAEDLSHSPHKALKCTECHDPHKSVVYKLGGVKKQCTECHQKRVRGSMRDVGVDCVDCHMAQMVRSALSVNEYQADVHSHLFRIMKDPIAKEDNIAAGNFWKQDDNGQSAITLDFACLQCHDNLTLDQAANAAKTIHRTTEMLDLTVNGDDRLQVVKDSDVVTVAFSVDAGEKAGMKADWWVIAQGPKGWTCWDGKKWKSGYKLWRKGVALADVPAQTVLNAKLAAGHYTYWVCVYPTDGTQNMVSVPVYVTKAPKPPRKTAGR